MEEKEREIVEKEGDFVREALDEIIDDELYLKIFNQNLALIGQAAPSLTKKQLLVLLQVSLEYPIADNSRVKGKEMRAAVACVKEAREAATAFIVSKFKQDLEKAAKDAENENVELF